MDNVKQSLSLSGGFSVCKPTSLEGVGDFGGFTFVQGEVYTFPNFAEIIAKYNADFAVWDKSKTGPEPEMPPIFGHREIHPKDANGKPLLKDGQPVVYHSYCCTAWKQDGSVVNIPFTALKKKPHNWELQASKFNVFTQNVKSLDNLATALFLSGKALAADVFVECDVWNFAKKEVEAGKLLQFREVEVPAEEPAEEPKPAKPKGK